MTNDYAAMITTVYIAVLAVGTVQQYTFFKAAADIVGQRFDLRKRIEFLERVRVGDEPEPMELWQATRPIEPKGDRIRLAMAIAWCVLAVTLVNCQIQVLRWAATPDVEANPDPDLAMMTFVVAVVAFCFLLADVSVRLLMIGLEARGLQRRYRDDFTPTEKLYLESLIVRAHEVEPRLARALGITHGVRLAEEVGGIVPAQDPAPDQAATGLAAGGSTASRTHDEAPDADRGVQGSSRPHQ
ncbi:hypothetical protein [Streptomyces chilikensis]|uniref:Uncharacterized protein n=1 Tax=Streptomyces chilikensis TaxID=1194079 RepID=A0ABV3EJC4_9ACTN